MIESEERYEEFLDEWPNTDGKHLIRDGVFYWDKWKNAQPRVLFLLKEAYADSDTFIDVRKLVRQRNKPKDQTWNRLADWAYLAQYGMKDSASLGDKSKSERFDALRSCGVMNIKKTGGVKQSNNKQIKQIALESADHLLKQIELLDPQIVICGNTWKAMKAVFESKKINCEKSPYDYTREVDGRYYLKLVHPAIRATKLISYSIPYLLHQSGIWKALGCENKE